MTTPWPLRAVTRSPAPHPGGLPACCRMHYYTLLLDGDDQVSWRTEVPTQGYHESRPRVIRALNAFNSGCAL